MDNTTIRKYTLGALCVGLLAVSGFASAQRGGHGGSFRGGSSFSRGRVSSDHFRGGHEFRRGGGGIGFDFGIGFGGPVYGGPVYADPYYDYPYYGPEYVGPGFGADVYIGGGGYGHHYYRGGGEHFSRGSSHFRGGGSSRGGGRRR